MSAVLLGLVAGFLSGHFGLGGGLITTPGIRLIGYGAYFAIGTPLLANIPTALSGAWTYGRHGHVDWPLAARLGIPGGLGAIIGSLFTNIVNPHVILLTTAVVIGFLSFRFFPAAQSRSGHLPLAAAAPKPLVGLAIGIASGFLGLGGGFLLIPYLSLSLGKDIKTVFGTSLAAILFITLPGALVHWLLGHVDLSLAGAIIVGVVPGAIAGARVAIAMPEKVLRVGFAVLLLALAFYLGYSELALLA